MDAYEHGITRFMTGMAVGFDMLEAEVVLSMKGLCPDIKLMAVVPYSGQAERFSDYNHRRYDALLAKQIRLSSSVTRLHQMLSGARPLHG